MWRTTSYLFLMRDVCIRIRVPNLLFCNYTTSQSQSLKSKTSRPVSVCTWILCPTRPLRQIVNGKKSLLAVRRLRASGCFLSMPICNGGQICSKLQRWCGLLGMNQILWAASWAKWERLKWSVTREMGIHAMSNACHFIWIGDAAAFFGNFSTTDHYYLLGIVAQFNLQSSCWII